MTPTRLIEKLTIDLPRKIRARSAARGPLPEPALPVDGGRGALFTDRSPVVVGANAEVIGQAALAEVSVLRWDTCPETGAALPESHRFELRAEPGAWSSARVAHRHRWFSTLARAGRETGQVAFSVAACQALGEWLVADRPEVGVPWLHASDAAVRLIHWSLGAGWLGDEMDPDLWRRMAGSAAAHAAFLEENLSLKTGETDHRLIAQATGLVVAGLTWPDLPGARRWWSLGLSLLNQHLPAQLNADGAPVDLSSAQLERTLTLALVARAAAAANGISFPGEAGAAIVRGAWFLRTLSEGEGAPHALGGGAEALLAPWGARPGMTPWNAAVTAGLDVGPAAPGAEDDATAAWLAGARPVGGEPLPPDEDWRMFSFRGSGVVVLHGMVKRKHSRVVFQAGEGRGLSSDRDTFHVTWAFGDVDVLIDPGAELSPSGLDRAEVHGVLNYMPDHHLRRPAVLAPQIRVARLDGRKATVVAFHEGARPARYDRDVRVEGSRITVTDELTGQVRGQVAVRWPLGPGWEVSQDGDDWSITQGKLTLKVQLAPELAWSVRREPYVWGEVSGDAPVLQGTGRAEGPIKLRCSFEIR